MLTRLKALLGKGQDQGFTLIELLIVILIVGILAAVATPLYLGYIRDSRTAEAKAVAGALWTAVQSNAISTCGLPATISNAYPKAGFSSTGETTPARWSVSVGGSNTLTIDCITGAFTPDGDLFTIRGAATDINFIQVKLNYSAAGTPPWQLRCSTDSGGAFVSC